MQNHEPINHLKVSDVLTHPTRGQTDLYLVRHGQTEGNVNGQFIGATDLPLDAQGERQAQELAGRFAEIPLDDIVTSPLQRAKRTAEAIGEVTGHSPIVVPGLSEMDFGNAEGLTFHQVIEQFPELRDDLASIANLDLKFPGGETRRGFVERVTTTFLGILERYEGKKVAAVAHGGVIGVLYAQLHRDPSPNMARYAVANCSIGHLVVTPDHTRIELWNDVSHLTHVIEIGT
jgi:broad specificity phosphatase PhoE